MIARFVDAIPAPAATFGLIGDGGALMMGNEIATAFAGAGSVPAAVAGVTFSPDGQTLLLTADTFCDLRSLVISPKNRQ